MSKPYENNGNPAQNRGIHFQTCQKSGFKHYFGVDSTPNEVIPNIQFNSILYSIIHDIKLGITK